VSGAIIAAKLLAVRSGSRNIKVEAEFPAFVSISTALAACGTAECEAAISGGGMKTKQRHKTITPNNQIEVCLIEAPFGRENYPPEFWIVTNY
jgi:hypothetical protein